MKSPGSMNRVYRLVWNHLLQGWVAVAETARGRGKASGRVGAIAALSLVGAGALAGPVGGQVTAGAASISQSGAAGSTTTTVRQGSQNVSLNWQGFNVGTGETVNFLQPTATAIAVNRILDGNGSQILGRVNANGQVWLINPNGILFGRDAQVNVGGLVASTLETSDAGLNGNTRRLAGSSRASVVNQGRITAADGGSVALIGHGVANTGTISARLGTVALGAGSAVTLTFADNRLLTLQVDESTLDALAHNGGLLRAEGGQVLMSAGARDALLASVVNNSGVIEARTVDQTEGRIVLLGGMAAGSVRVDGSLDASAPHGATGANGGFVETSAAKVTVADSARVTTLAPQGRAGTWLIDPTDFTVAASGGDMTGAAVGTALAGGNFAVQSTLGSTGTAGNVTVNDTVAWSANQLTLNAKNNIIVNAALTGTGTASLALSYGQGAIASGNSSTYSINAPVTLPAGDNFSTLLGSDGTLTSYTVITSLGAAGSATGTDLQGMAGNLSRNYALGADIDASATAGWNSNAGFAPVGSTLITAFGGDLAGLGHSVSGLTINRPATDNVGLFGVMSGGYGVRDLSLTGGSITGGNNVGAVAGQVRTATLSHISTSATVTGISDVGGVAGIAKNGSGVNDLTASGRVSATGDIVGGVIGDLQNNNGSIGLNLSASGAVSGASSVGGVAGWLHGGGSLDGASATGSVTGTGGYVGGLVGNLGQDSSARILNSHASGAVTGAGDYVGGLAGRTSGGSSINTSSARGAVTSTADYVGGLVGQQESGSGSGNSASGNVHGVDYVGGYAGATTSGMAVINGSASGAISGHSHVGGLIGDATISAGAISSHASGSVTATGDEAGGLIGHAQSGASSSDSSASGDVSGTTHVGGLIGYALNGSGATRSHASGSVTASGDFVGGLIGYAGNSSDISGSYATGNVSGQSFTGGLTGFASNSGITDAFATGNVSGTDRVGGLVGQSDFGALNRVYAAGAVTGTSDMGGLVGLLNSATLTSGYWNSTRSGQPAGVGSLVGSSIDTSIGRSEAQAFTADSYSFTFTNAAADAGTATADRWVMANANGSLVTSAGSSVASATMPMLAGTWSTTVSDAVGLQLMALKLDGNYTLGNPIDASATGRAVTGSGNGGVWGSSGFMPIGVYGSSNFSGSLDGLSRTINNLTIALPGQYYAALFSGLATGGEIRNLGLVGGSVTGGYGAGSLVSGSLGRISNSFSTVDVAGIDYVGGLVGGNLPGAVIADSYATGHVTASGAGVGGMAGVNQGTIRNSYASGTVTGAVAGGLVGQDAGGTLNNSYWNMTRTGQLTSAGGGTGLSAAQMQQQARFGGLDFTDTWFIYEGQSTPLLRSWLTPLTVTVALPESASKVYDGSTAYSGGTARYSIASPDMDQILGSLGGTLSSKDVGDRTLIVGGLYSGQLGYLISYGPSSGTVAVTPRTVALAAARSYDGSTGLSGSDVTITTGVGAETLSYGIATASSSHVADNASNFVSALTLADGSGVNGGLATNYRLPTTLNRENAPVTISPATLTAALTNTGVTKVYDGSTSAPGSFVPGYSFTGLVGGDTAATLSGGTAGAFNSAHVAAANSVSVSGLSLGGITGANNSAASDYTLSSASATSAAGSASITPAVVTPTLISSDMTKVYDGSTSAPNSFSLDYSLAGLVEGDSANLQGVSLAFNSAHVATATAAIVQGLYLSGVSGERGSALSDYVLSASSASVAASITPAMLTATLTSTGVTKVYDGSTRAPVSFTPIFSVTGLIEGDSTAALSSTGVAFNSANVLGASTVTTSGLSLSGITGENSSAASDYMLGAFSLTSAAGSASITPKNVTLAAARTYDGSTSLSGVVTVTTGVGRETLGYSGATAHSSHVADNASNFVSAIALVDGAGVNGGMASNYALPTLDAANAPVTITPATLTATLANTGATKVYDGSTRAPAGFVPGYGFTGLVEGDSTAALSSTGVAFNSANVATADAVTASGLSLSGITGTSNSAVSDYVLGNSSVSTAARITPLALTVNGVTATGKTYDSSRNAALSGTASVTGVASDQVSLSGSGSGRFADADVASGKAVTVSGYTLTGDSAGNYQLMQPVGLTADIAQAWLSYVAAPSSFISGQTLIGLSGTAAGFLGDDTLASATTGTLAWTTTATSASAPGRYALNGAGLSARNYQFQQDPGNLRALTLQAGSPPQVVVDNSAQINALIAVVQPLNTSTMSNLPHLPATPLTASAPEVNNANGTAGNNTSNGNTSAGAPVLTSLPMGGGTGRMQVINGGVKLTDDRP